MKTSKAKQILITTWDDFKEGLKHSKKNDKGSLILIPLLALLYVLLAFIGYPIPGIPGAIVMLVLWIISQVLHGRHAKQMRIYLEEIEAIEERIAEIIDRRPHFENRTARYSTQTPLRALEDLPDDDF